MSASPSPAVRDMTYPGCPADMVRSPDAADSLVTHHTCSCGWKIAVRMAKSGRVLVAWREPIEKGAQTI